jgi:dTDP-4-amino-4,6-dideoxygalactose transaminase
MIRFLDLSAQYYSIKEEIDTAISSVIRDAAFVSGAYAKRFEEEFAASIEVDYCVGVGNGTDAIEIAIEALNLPKGSEIIVPGNSFIASSEAVTRSGHRVVFADVDPECYTLTAGMVKEKLTEKTAAIIAVHLYGHPCDMDSLMALAKEHGLKVIEDCAQAHFAEYKGRRVGSLGDVATFSFYPGKNLGAYGDAGAITTNSQELATICRKIANHGRVAKYDHDFEGRNSRLDGMQAAVLSVKLPHLNAWTDRRIQLSNFYLQELVGIPDLILPVRKVWAKQVYHLFVVRTSQRDALKSFLAEHEIETGVHYPISLPKLAAYSYLGQGQDPMFVNHTDSMLLSLPIGEHLSIEQARYVVETVRQFFGRNV